MLEFSVRILGCGSAMPTVNRNPSSQIVTYNTNHYLIDCGEGTQLQLRKYKISLLKINNIFISHLHGDHYYGIFGLLSTFSMLGRKNDLNIFAPQELKDICDYVISNNNEELNYKINFIPLIPKSKELIFSDKYLDVFSFPLKHSKAVWGFSFVEKRKEANIKKNMIEKYSLSIKDILKIKKGEDFICTDGTIIKNGELTVPPPEIRSYAYCSDTLPLKKLKDILSKINLLYHESTYANNNKLLAKKTCHSTAQQAAEIAKLLEVDKLLLGHYSSRYDDLSVFLNDAKSVFDNSYLSFDGLKIEI